MSITSETNSVSFRIPKSYNWKPKEDITAYELALCLPVLTGNNWYDVEYFIEALPENARRHFEQAGQHSVQRTCAKCGASAWANAIEVHGKEYCTKCGASQ